MNAILPWGGVFKVFVECSKEPVFGYRDVILGERVYLRCQRVILVSFLFGFRELRKVLCNCCK